MTEISNLISELREYLESAAFLVSKGESEKAAHSTIVQGLVLLAQIEAQLQSSKESNSVGSSQRLGNQKSESTHYSKSRDDEITPELNKVHRRVPKWFRNPSQNNSKILLCFLELSAQEPNVTTRLLRSKCYDVKDFDGNFNQMKNFGDKNHGKVFEEKNGVVTLWEPVSNFIIDQYEDFNPAVKLSPSRAQQICTMNDKQLDRSLRSIGKECFVKYFEEFSDLSNKSEDLIELLMVNEGYEETGCKTRVSQSRRIIESGRGKDALELICKSERVPHAISEQARELKMQLNKTSASSLPV